MNHLPGPSKAEEEYGQLTSWVDLFTRDTVAFMGIIGNVMIILVRMQRHMRNTFNKLLVALAFFDTLTLLVSPLVSCMKMWKNVFRVAFPYIIWPLGHFSITSSVLMTVVIAYERFIAVRHPLNYKKGQGYRVTRYVSCVTATSIIFSATKFFEYTPDDCNGIRFTKLYTNDIYLVYNIVIYKLLLTTFIPSLILLYLYAKIYHDIKASHTMQAACSIRSRNGRENSIKGDINRDGSEAVRRKEGKQARIFAGVVITFFACNVPDVFVKIVHIVKYIQSPSEPPLWFLVALKIRDFCIILNSAINIVIYTCLSKQFRKEFRATIHKCIRCSSGPTNANNSVRKNSMSLKENSVRRTRRQTSL